MVIDEQSKFCMKCNDILWLRLETFRYYDTQTSEKLAKICHFMDTIFHLFYLFYEHGSIVSSSQNFFVY
jgi:hypothetical protein